jgi:hypothetical protein
VRRPALALALLCLAAGLSSCGDDDPQVPPQVSDIAITCTEPQPGDFVDRRVVDELQARVTDDNRDLVEVRGVINGIRVELDDNDADRVYTWSPGRSFDPMICAGDFTVRIIATDLNEHTADITTTVEK